MTTAFHKRHYNVIARLLKRTTTKEYFTERLIELFLADNSNFDEQRFRDAIVESVNQPSNYAETELSEIEEP